MYLYLSLYIDRYIDDIDIDRYIYTYIHTKAMGSEDRSRVVEYMKYFLTVIFCYKGTSLQGT